jgi:hypothetical protein
MCLTEHDTVNLLFLHVSLRRLAGDAVGGKIEIRSRRSDIRTFDSLYLPKSNALRILQRDSHVALDIRKHSITLCCTITNRPWRFGVLTARQTQPTQMASCTAPIMQPSFQRKHSPAVEKDARTHTHREQMLVRVCTKTVYRH